MPDASAVRQILLPGGTLDYSPDALPISEVVSDGVVIAGTSCRRKLSSGVVSSGSAWVYLWRKGGLCGRRLQRSRLIVGVAISRSRVCHRGDPEIRGTGRALVKLQHPHHRGGIFMVVGVVGFIASLVFWASWGASEAGTAGAPSTSSQPGASLKNAGSPACRDHIGGDRVCSYRLVCRNRRYSLDSAAATAGPRRRRRGDQSGD